MSVVERVRYIYRDSNGRERFQHVKLRLDPPERGRNKKCVYRCRTRPDHAWIHRKPPGADGLLYRLPELLDEALWHPRRSTGLEVWWTEGEGDAETLAGLGRPSTSHHQAAGHATLAQAETFAGYRGRLVLAADRDVAGAVDAVRRYDLLRAVGIRSGQLRVVLTPLRFRGADVTDHVAASLPLSALVEVPIRAARISAARATPAGFRRAGYVPWFGTKEERKCQRSRG
jgi:hypothetical protein